jgi:hypothetical protein
VPEEAGGGGATLGDALAVVRRAARSAAPMPLGETALAGLLLDAGLSVPASPALGKVLRREVKTRNCDSAKRGLLAP